MKNLVCLVLFLCLGKICSAQVSIFGTTLGSTKFSGGTVYAMPLAGGPVTTECYMDTTNVYNSYYPYLCKAGNGSFYSVSNTGGTYNNGCIVEYNPVTDAFVQRSSFEEENNLWGNGYLTAATDGNIYGVAQSGNNFNTSTIFKYDYVNDTIIILQVNPPSLVGAVGRPLVYGSGGKLYGITAAGGTNGRGVFFSFDINTNAVSVLYDIATPDGYQTQMELFSDTINNKLYGISVYGGANSLGTIYEFDVSNNTYNKLHDFTQTLYFHDINRVGNKLIFAASNAGLYGFGSIYEFDLTTSSFTRTFDFDGSVFGKYPSGSQFLKADGKLLGISAMGGANNAGVVYQYDPTTSLAIKKMDVPAIDSVWYSNAWKYNGKLTLMGSQLYGWLSDPLTMFSYDTASNTFNDLKRKFSFQGGGPMLNMVESINGKFYGMLYSNKPTSANQSYGGIYEYDPLNKTNKMVVMFTGPNGKEPQGNLFITPAGIIYGTTPVGGINDKGVLFMYNTLTGVYSKILDFNGSNGNAPKGAPMLALNGKIYGATVGGGVSTFGTIYEIDPVTNVTVRKCDFPANAAYPRGDLVEFLPGKIYGYAQGTVANGDGIIYEYDIISNTVTKKIDFNEGITGQYHTGSLISFNGKLYGTCSHTGVEDYGSIHEYDPINNTLSKIYDFDSITGSRPIGGPMLASDGNLYGVTLAGGQKDLGVIYKFDPLTLVYTTLYEFYGKPGYGAYISTLMEACPQPAYETFAVADSVICRGDTAAKLFSIHSQTGVNYSWSYSGTGVSINANGDSALLNFSPTATSGILEIIGSNACATRAVTSLNIMIHENPIVVANTSDTTACIGLSVLLNGSGAGTYSWSGGVIDNQVFVPTVSQTYYVTGTDSYGCSGQDSVFISVQNLPMPTIVAHASDSSVCAWTSILFYGTGGVNYVWNNQVMDSITFYVTQTDTFIVTGIGVNGCINRDSAIVVVNPNCQTVYPGDANNDGIANNNDILELGLQYGRWGYSRSSISNAWLPYDAPVWWTDTVSTGYNLNHADCNGDGTINLNDTLAVNLNYGLTHTARPAIQNSTNTTGDIYFSSVQTSYSANQNVAIDVYLGESTSPLQNFYGVTFTIAYTDNTLILPGSLSFSIDNISWVGNINTNSIRLAKTDESTENVYTAICRINHTNTSGSGKIGTIRFTSSGVSGSFSLSALDAYYINSLGVQTPLTSGTYSVTINSSVSLQNNPARSPISVFPNPNKGEFIISNLNPGEEYQLEMKDILGRTIFSDFIKTTSAKTDVSIDTPCAGIYWLQVISRSGNSTHKIVVE